MQSHAGNSHDHQWRQEAKCKGRAGHWAIRQLWHACVCACAHTHRVIVMVSLSSPVIMGWNTVDHLPSLSLGCTQSYFLHPLTSYTLAHAPWHSPSSPRLLVKELSSASCQSFSCIPRMRLGQVEEVTSSTWGKIQAMQSHVSHPQICDS